MCMGMRGYMVMIGGEGSIAVGRETTLLTVDAFPSMSVSGAGWAAEQHFSVQPLARMQRGVRLPGSASILGHERAALCGASPRCARGRVLPALREGPDEETGCW